MNEKNFYEFVSTRHSTRAFKNTPLSQDQIKSIIDSAIAAPSAGNLQSYQIFIVTNQSDKERLVESAHGQEYIAQASVVLVFCVDPKRSSTEYGERGENLFCIQDATISCAYSQIAAHDLGLSSVWIGSFDEDKVSQILSLSNDIRPVAILPIGVANETPEITPRRSFDEIIHQLK